MARSDFGSRGAYAHSYSVDSRYFDARTPFIETSRAPAALPRARARVEGGQPGVDRRDSRQVGSRDPGRVESRERVDRREPDAAHRDRGAAREIVIPPAASAGVAAPRGAVGQAPPATRDYRPANDYRPPTPDYRPPTRDYRPPSVGARPAERPAERPAPPGAVPRERTVPPPHLAPQGAVPPQRTAPPGAAPSGAVPQDRVVPPQRTAPPGAAPSGAVPQERAVPPQRPAPPGAAPSGAVPQERAVPRAGAQPSGKSDSPGAKRPR